MAKGDKITKSKAKKWVKNYKDKHPKSDPKTLWSELFDKKIVTDLLSEPGCEGLRIYNSYDDNGNLKFILEGTDANGNNLLPANEESTTEAVFLVEDGSGCPINCPPNDL